MKELEQTLDSREVAEMVGKSHSELLKDIRRYIGQFNAGNLPFVDFFKEGGYLDAKGEMRTCYSITKKGCEFISHKLTGIKGTEFTSRYINRFHDMEQTIKEGKQKKVLSEGEKPIPLSSANMMVKNIISTLEKANVSPLYVAAEVKRIYTDLGYEVKAPLITDEAAPELYTCEQIAKKLGVMSKSGLPHNQAIADIIRKLDIDDKERENTAYSQNGHDGVSVQYKQSVIDKVGDWLKINNYPSKIPFIDASGVTKQRTVMYE